MKTKFLWLFLALVVCLGLGWAGAEERLGIQVYPGAKFDADVSKVVSDAMNVEGYCYRTADGAAKVVEFYKKQPGFRYLGGDEKGGMLKKDRVNVTVQNPWMDLKTGALNKDTLLTISKLIE